MLPGVHEGSRLLHLFTVEALAKTGWLSVFKGCDIVQSENILHKWSFRSSNPRLGRVSVMAYILGSHHHLEGFRKKNPLSLLPRVSGCFVLFCFV